MEEREKIFLRVVEAGSLKAAAEQLNTDPSSVSRKVSSLEARLGVKLLQRSTKRSVPTEAGTIYYEGLRKLADEQQALEERVTGQTDAPRGMLKVAAPLDFGALFVAPLLQEMLDNHNELTVEMVLGSQFDNISAEGIDVAVRVGKLPDSSLVCRRLGTVPRVLVASRSYVEKHGLPRSPEDLSSYDFVFYTGKQRIAPVTATGPDGPVSVDVTGRFTVNSVAALRALVEDGKGMHLGPVWAFREGIKSGRLVALLQDYELEAFPVHALYASTAYVPAKIRAFIDLLASRLARAI